jgi:hypothetical protein
VKPELKDGKIVMHYSPTEEFKDKAKSQTHTREIDGDTLTLVCTQPPYEYLYRFEHAFLTSRLWKLVMLLQNESSKGKQSKYLVASLNG